MKKKHLMTRAEAEKVLELVLSPSRYEKLAKSYLALLDVVEEQKATIAAMQR